MGDPGVDHADAGARPSLPGTAAALVGGLQFGLGGAATPLAGALGGTAVVMGALMLGFIAIGLGAQVWASRRVR